VKDIYLYEGTSILKNKLDIRDKELLDEAEAEVQKMGDEIDALRAVRFLNKKKGTLEN
jgi:fido (protein-threonine AMPylation protein)